jgi:glycine cleavage system H protein
MKLDKDCRYAESHEWVRMDGDEGTVGITDYAQQQLSNIVYVELPEIGDAFGKEEVFATVESVKAAADVYMPIGGEIIEVNEGLEDAPQLVNEDPFGAAWFARFTADDLSELDDLMDADAYERFVAEEEAKGA